MSKEITIPVPDGKRAEWINGVLTLVDEPKVDNRPITERIKTFKDACNELGEEHPLVEQYRETSSLFKGKWASTFTDILAYLKLRIIVAALNEGWEPKFEKNECRYIPWFSLYTKEKYDELDDNEKGCCVLRSGNNTYAKFSYVNCNVNYETSFSDSDSGFGSRLTFRTKKLAAYAGRQFTKEWVDFVFNPLTGEELNGKS